MAENRIKEIFQNSNTAEQYFRGYCNYLGELLGSLDYSEIEKVAQLIFEKYKSGQTIFLAGNGGSAATASHFALDLAQCCPPEAENRFRAVSLTDNAPWLTALANDIGYEEVFTGQIKNLLRKNDLLVVISASGNSPNVVAAVRLTKELGGVTVGVVGFDGGELAQICDHVIHVRSHKGEYGPVEDIHLVLDHMITSYLRMSLSQLREKQI